MKPRTSAILLVVVACLLALGSNTAAAPSPQSPACGETAGAWVSEGGGYRLTSRPSTQSAPPQEPRPVAGGGRYLLFGPQRTAAAGSGCCCSYLPGILRNVSP